MEKDQRNEDKLSGEIEQIEIEYSDVQNQAQQVIDILSNPRTYDKILKTLSTEQTELHCTPPSATRESEWQESTTWTTCN